MNKLLLLCMCLSVGLSVMAENCDCSSCIGPCVEKGCFSDGKCHCAINEYPTKTKSNVSCGSSCEQTQHGKECVNLYCLDGSQCNQEGVQCVRDHVC